MYWILVGSDVYGGKLYGSWHTPEDAAQAVARMVLEAFSLQDGIVRSYTIIKAKDKKAAERRVKKLADDL